MVTPHISLRVDKEALDRWQANCLLNNTTVSSRIRLLMDAWCDYEEDLQMDAELLSSKVDLNQLKEEYGIV